MNSKAIAYQKQYAHAQDELAIKYMPALKAMAYRLKERLPNHIDIMDLISVGAEELVKAARRYDENLNRSFWGYAQQRVNGSMLDYLRSLDILSRGNRKIVKSIEKEINKYMAKHDEEPSDQYLADALGETIEKIKKARIASDIYTVMPIEDQLSFYSNDESTNSKVLKSELISIIQNILKKSHKREQTIIQLYYFEELNLKEISNIIGITESRVSQIHKSVLAKIRDKLEGKENG